MASTIHVIVLSLIYAILASGRQSLKEAAVEARHLIHYEKYADMNAVYQSGSLTNSPVGLIEYFADCGMNGNVVMLMVTIGTIAQEWHAGSNISMSVRTPENVYSVAANPRISLQGNWTYIETKHDLRQAATCFFEKHPDAVWWRPGNKVHDTRFVEFQVSSVYHIGGFGDTKHIGFIPLDLYHNVSLDEIDAYDSSDRQIQTVGGRFSAE